eukprot:COSAG05_NODE_1022_length_6130_cov_48.450174_4_plen_139_part_00
MCDACVLLVGVCVERSTFTYLSDVDETTPAFAVVPKSRRADNIQVLAEMMVRATTGYHDDARTYHTHTHTHTHTHSLSLSLSLCVCVCVFFVFLCLSLSDSLSDSVSVALSLLLSLSLSFAFYNNSPYIFHSARVCVD